MFCRSWRVGRWRSLESYGGVGSRRPRGFEGVGGRRPRGFGEVGGYESFEKTWVKREGRLGDGRRRDIEYDAGILGGVGEWGDFVRWKNLHEEFLRGMLGDVVGVLA